jgi:RNA polymerase sigma-70 factor, ECF subfamily
MFRRTMDSYDIEQIVKTYGKDVMRVCNYYLRSKQDAEDAFQEVFVKVIRKHSTFCNNSEYKTWLTRITINTCKNYLKKQALNKTVDYSVDLLDTVIQDNSSCLDDYDELYQLIITLPVDYKDVLLLKFYMNYTSKEISKILKITESAVNSRLYRAKTHLKNIVTEKGWSYFG